MLVKDWAAERSAKPSHQLVLAAMRLMAEQGIEGVSLRAVNVEAGARNCSAAHYHFGDKLGLVEAIVDTLAEQAACRASAEVRNRFTWLPALATR